MLYWTDTTIGKSMKDSISKGHSIEQRMNRIDELFDLQNQLKNMPVLVTTSDEWTIGY